MLSRRGWMVPGLLGAGLVVTAVPAQAQSNIDAGKSPAQIFSDTCNACHRSPRELKPTNAGFLREHYTTGAREAAAMAAYVAAVGSDPQAVRQRRPPAMGAGQAPPPAPPSQAPAAAAAAGQTPGDNGIRPPQSIPSNEQAKPGDAQAALPAAPNRRAQPGDQARSPQGQARAAALRARRPSESLDAATPFATLATGTTPATAEAPASPAPALEPFEE
jgi:hypothetical protein